MPKELYLSKHARKFLKRADPITARRILVALEGLKQNPPQGDIKPYKSQPKFYRLKVGGYRVIFCIQNDIIEVTDIDSRGQIYK